MKKLLVFLWALLAVSASVKAQGLTATLQQGDKMTPFYGPDAFVQAYNAAQKGAVITLSAGEFNTVDSIMKEVSIIGNGYREDKTVLKERNFEAYGEMPISLIIRADNVKLEGLDMNCVMIRKSNNLLIRHCKIYNLWGVTANYTGSPRFLSQHNNTIVDQCVIGTDCASTGENYCIKNTIVFGGFRWYLSKSDATDVLVSNCIFGCWVGATGTAIPHAVLKNCLIGCKFESGINVVYDCSVAPRYEFYNNVFFGGLGPESANYKGGTFNLSTTFNEDTRWVTPELNWAESSTCRGNTAASYSAVFGDSDDENPLLAPIITTITGDDGKVVGPYGGTGFSWNPSIPRIVESNIDSYTDAEGKLNVKVKVELNN